MQLLNSLVMAVFAATAVSAAKPTVYLIRHGEKPADDNIVGLSAVGEERAQCLRDVFGWCSDYNIGYILAQMPKASGKRERPYLTVLPLSEDLGLDVDISCDRDDPQCVENAVNNYEGDGNILICWEHDALTTIAEQLGAKNAGTYPDASFNLIWTLPPDYSKITDITSEMCPGLDV